jgi:hypothetical protein
MLAGALRPADAARLARAGATIDADPDARYTRVEWPATTLRDFLLYDVLLHEVAHHTLQQYAGKRTARLARTHDHEARAAQLAATLRRLLLDEGV